MVSLRLPPSGYLGLQATTLSPGKFLVAKMTLCAFTVHSFVLYSAYVLTACVWLTFECSNLCGWGVGWGEGVVGLFKAETDASAVFHLQPHL